MAVEVTAGVNLPQALKRRSSLKLRGPRDIHFVHREAIKRRYMRSGLLCDSDCFVPPDDPLWRCRVGISVIWVIQRLERRRQALRTSSCAKSARDKGPLPR